MFVVVENGVGQPGDWLTQMVIVNDSCNAKVHVTFWFAPNNYKFEKYVITILEEGQGTCRPGKCEKDKNHVSVIYCTNICHFVCLHNVTL